jgi:hypothetical protein
MRTLSTLVSNFGNLRCESPRTALKLREVMQVMQGRATGSGWPILFPQCFPKRFSGKQSDLTIGLSY